MTGRVLRRALVVAAVLPLAGALGLWLWLRSSLPHYSGTMRVAGLSNEAVIVRDAKAVPHIRAGSVEDALFALGFAHAQDRLFMLEYYRHQSQGRLAELIGPAGLQSDIEVRLMNTEVTRQSVLAWQPPDAIARMSAYVAGINAFLAQRSGALPPEFLYLGAAPSPWTVADAFMIDNLTDAARSGWAREITYLILRQRLPERLVDAIQADYAEPGVVNWPESSASLAAVSSLASQERAVARPDRSRASNAWAVSARRSVSGAPLFASDPHLEFTLPSIFTPVRIETPQWRFAGFVIPGIAWFAGHNSRLHWGMTHAAEDMTDVYVEESDASGTRYRIAGGWKALEIHDQVIKVRGAPDVPMRIRVTERGPVISDHLERAKLAQRGLPDRQMLVLAGVDARRESGGGRQYGLNHELMLAGSLAEADRILARQFDVDNLVYADEAGDIAIRTVAAVLQRDAGEGLRPREGWRAAAADGTQFRPPNELPHAKNPPSGCVFNANQPVQPGSAHCGPTLAGSLRAERLRTLLAASPRHSLESFRAIQLDTRSLAATEMLPSLRSIVPTRPLERQALSILEDWNGETSVDSVAASLFHVWLREFDAAIVGTLSARWSVDLPHPTLRRYVQMLQRGSEWCSAVQPSAADALAACQAIATVAFRRAVDALKNTAGEDPAEWRWGRFHQAVFEHPVFSRVSWLRKFAERRVPVGGGPETVNAADGGWRAGTEFPVYHGALTRRLESIGDAAQNRVAFAAGVSGNPLSAHYDDQIEPWARGEYFSIEAEPPMQRRIGTLRLVPTSSTAP